ncbi:OmpA/MotB family protein [Aestuariispira insulae]|uniref:Chemotaxis protein MotB n=1 Tax=Aestuariispira insulae TaxID=1461337 RepID=A0A3D9HKM5_9PROT|nr:flagellar motor protein MotB [Aestuariispira insulae]RED49841.1 chemotaxis protein MotB [Aestuariispira insulae]
MARRRKEESGSDDSEDWMTTYADAITLLMAFFVMLVSFSKVDLKVFEEVQAGIEEAIGGNVDSERPIFTLQANISQIMDATPDIPPEDVDVGFDDNGVVIDFGSGSFFKPGTAELTEAATKVLGRIKRELEEPPYDLFEIDVEGHTDNDPVNTPRFPSNWELSAGRAATVVRYLIDLGAPSDRLKASGFAETRPKFPNEDVLGNPLPENKKKNRRVSIRLYPKPQDIAL